MDDAEKAAREREARAIRFVRQLRADCRYVGIPSEVVARMTVRELIDARDRAYRLLASAAPGDPPCRD